MAFKLGRNVLFVCLEDTSFKMSLKSIGRRFAHFLLPIRKAQIRFVKEFSETVDECTILEIGCGGNKDFIKYFETRNDVVQSDIKRFPGCEVLDVTELNLKEQYDVILAINVLEHIFNYRLAISNMFNALHPGGHLVLSVPFFYPFHDLPNDYWRFTPFSLEKELNVFHHVRITQSGLKWAPHSIHAIATKQE